MNLVIFKQIVFEGLKSLKKNFFSSRRDRYGYLDETAKVYQPGFGNKRNVFLYKNTVVHEYHKFLTHEGKFIMKDNSIAAAGLTVITFNHTYVKLEDFPGGQEWNVLNAKNVIVDEHVWLGANVTLCPGVHINRGVIVAAGSVCIKSNEYPPYSIVAGNPAKFIKFRLNVHEQIEHEKLYFPVENRISNSLLEENYFRFQEIN